MITIDLSFFSELATHSPFYIMGALFIYGGWIPVLVIGLWAAKILWLRWRQRFYAATVKYVLLAIDIPKENEEGPKAVEHIFSQLAGISSGLDFRDKWWYGKFQLGFSLEIISDGGYVQFLIRTPEKFRDLVEAAFYAQYPDAEILEVEDYAAKIPLEYPNETHNLFGTEFILAKPSAYPLRTYPQFEHSFSRPGTQFKDPLSALLELMSRIQKDEQLWLQIVVIPTGSDWKEQGEAIVAKLLGRKPAVKETVWSKAGEMPVKFIEGVAYHGFGLEPAPPPKEDAAKIAQLSPGERLVVEAVQNKLSKIGFLTKFRFVYVAKKEAFNAERAAFIKAALQQYGSLSLNSFKGYGPVVPQTDYFWQRWFAEAKKTSLAKNYSFRDPCKGAPLNILNTEELATLYHFPVVAVKAPLLKKTEAKRAEPPFKLPVHIQQSANSNQPTAVSGELKAESRELEANTAILHFDF